MVESSGFQTDGIFSQLRQDTDYYEWVVCDECNGIGSDENANFWCSDCHSQGGTWQNADPVVMALIDVADAAVECIGPCDLAPGGKRQWCMAHSEWTPCPFQALAGAVDVLSRTITKNLLTTELT